jgi:cellulose synthase/poly-beta-1,6-N-acetylglucosamine synthase-like glycosyltransferase
MDEYQTAIALVFWACAASVGYAYAGYPTLIWALSRLFGRRPRPPEPAVGDLPRVSLLIAAYNEEDVIADRLRNALALDYPAGALEIIVGTDGCTDHTAEIVRSFSGVGVRLLEFAENRGKPAVLNDLAATARGEILLPSDANAMHDTRAVRHLVRWFADPGVGAVCGRLVLVDRADGRNADGLYWKYETFLKRCEGRLGALLGANGANYAIRKRLYTPIPPDTIVEDLAIPLLARLRSGCRIVYDGEAVAHEETSPDIASEFHRRARIGAGGYQAIGRLWRMLDPRHGWVAFAFLSHKVLRWTCPFFLLGALVSNLALLDLPLYRAIFAAQAALYTLAALPAALARAGLKSPRPLRLPALFVGMNAALLVGFWRWLTGGQRPNWRRTARTVGAVTALHEVVPDTRPSALAR